jgi:hypothetical protein
MKSAIFKGTESPRHLRVLHALGVSPQPREPIDDRAGCSNGSELLADLRRRGLILPCQRTRCIDRDGFIVEREIYLMTVRDGLEGPAPARGWTMTEQNQAALLAVLERIATAHEKQTAELNDLVSMTCGISNRIEDLAACMPSFPDSFWTLVKGRK